MNFQRDICFYKSLYNFSGFNIYEPTKWVLASWCLPRLVNIPCETRSNLLTEEIQTSPIYRVRLHIEIPKSRASMVMINIAKNKLSSAFFGALNTNTSPIYIVWPTSWSPRPEMSTKPCLLRWERMRARGSASLSLSGNTDNLQPKRE